MEIRILELLNEIKSLIIGKVNERWLTLKEVSEYTSLSESTIRRAIQKGVLKSSKCKYCKYLENHGNGLLSHWP